LADRLAAAFAGSGGEHPAVTVCGIDNPARLAEGLQRSDAVVILVDAAQRPDDAGIGPILAQIAGIQPLPRSFVALCYPAGIGAGAAARWSRLAGVERHVHLSGAGGDGSLSRLVRLIDGTATGLALAGGGARGFAHIGVLQALAAAGIPVDFICGTSMGAIIAAQYAAGFGIEQIVCNVRRGYVGTSSLADLTLPRVALYSGRATARKLKAIFGDTAIEDLPVPFFAVAADLCSAEAVELDRGPVWQAVKISSSIPGMLPPTLQDGQLLVDGGLLDNLPVGALRRRLSGRIIAADVSVANEFAELADGNSRLPGIGQILMRTSQLASVKHSRDAGTPADLYLNPALYDVGMTDFARIDEIMARGFAHASERLASAEWAS
jgi:predicted acylesterase/phospholipase RssA